MNSHEIYTVKCAVLCIIYDSKKLYKSGTNRKVEFVSKCLYFLNVYLKDNYLKKHICFLAIRILIYTLLRASHMMHVIKSVKSIYLPGFQFFAKFQLPFTLV